MIWWLYFDERLIYIRREAFEGTTHFISRFEGCVELQKYWIDGKKKKEKKRNMRKEESKEEKENKKIRKKKTHSLILLKLTGHTISQFSFPPSL